MDILEKITELLKEETKSYPSKEEMVQYLLDVGALFHHDEGTREQFERMREEDLKIYYDDYKAAE